MSGPREPPAMPASCRAGARRRPCPLAARRWICGGYLAWIAVLSLVPAWLFPSSLAEVPGIDKWIHVAMYGGLGMLLRWAAGAGRLPWRAWGLPLAGAGYGLLMECLQCAMNGAGRAFSWGDAGANLVGVVLLWTATEWVMAREAKIESK